MILISVYRSVIYKYRRHRFNRHHRHRKATNEIASLFFFVGCRARMKEDILSIKCKILIIGTNLDNQPKKREGESKENSVE